MVEAGQGAGLAQEPLADGFVRQVFEAEELDGRSPAQAVVDGQEHVTHGASADGAQHAITSHLVAGSDRGGTLVHHIGSASSSA